MTNKPPAAPKSLGRRGRDLWRRVLTDYELSPSEQAVLEAAALAYDRLTTAQAVLNEEGLVLEGRYGPKAHPMTAVARDATTLLARCLRQLDVALDDEPIRLPARRGATPGPRPRGRAQREET